MAGTASLIKIIFALILSAILMGCASSPPSSSNNAQNASANNSSAPNLGPQTPAIADEKALREEVASMQAEQQALQAKLNSALARGDYLQADEAMQALANFTSLLEPKLDELCRRQNRECGAELFKLKRWVPCSSNFSNYVLLRQDYLNKKELLEGCQRSCSGRDDAASCLFECNPALHSLQKACIPLRSSISQISQVCGQSLDDSFYTDLQLQSIDCQSIALRKDYPSPNSAQAANETSKPAISGFAAIDPNNGAYKSKNCFINASPSVIFENQEVKINIRAYAPSGEEITYTCGDGEPRRSGYGGLMDITRLCRYDIAGPKTVWVAMDGYVCASVPLDVEPRSTIFYAPSCRIAANSRSKKYDGTSATYWAVVLLRHQPQNATLRWSCGQETFNVSLGQFWNESDINGALNVSCIFNEWSPFNIAGHAIVDGKDCGAISDESQ